jgi:hypothetical protein
MEEHFVIVPIGPDRRIILLWLPKALLVSDSLQVTVQWQAFVGAVMNFHVQ